MLKLKKLISTKSNKPYYVLGVDVYGEFIPLTYDKQTILLYVLAKGITLPEEVGEYDV